MKVLLHAFLSGLVILMSCNTASKKEADNEQFDVENMPEESIEVKEIIYSLYLPTDIVQLFEETGTNFNPERLIPINSLPKYEDQEQMALVMGALGVDMSYCKIFQQTPSTAAYYDAIELLSEKLEIPKAIFLSASKRIDLYFDKPDSLSIIINNIFEEVNDHFKSNEQDALASISLFGGWIEAMAIAAEIYDRENHFEMGHRILQQKFTLNNMISLLSNYQESLHVRGYILLLSKLRQEFDNVDIMYKKEGFNIDTTNKRLQTTGSEIVYATDTLDEISNLIQQIHNEVFN